jgi:tRNA pseudouridine38-40 synthase
VRWRLDIAYDGTAFSGWAAQRGLRTVQAELEEWLPRILRLDAPVSLVCAGRTDAGVHARGQVAHVDLPDDVINDDGKALTRRLDRALPVDLVVRRVSTAPDGFDARFSAIWRRYVYRLIDAATPVDPLVRNHVARIHDRIDLVTMNSAAPSLLGLRDFAPFCRRREGASTIRTLLDLRAERQREVVEITVRADAFCHSMVRSLVGALVAVGSGRRDLNWLSEVIGNPVRNPSVTVMPAHGLTLEEVGYPPDDQLASRAEVARTRRKPSDPRQGADE